MITDVLDYITIKGFKSIASVEKLALRPINVVIGANGSGKSNFVGAFSFLGEIRDGRLAHYVTKSGGAEKVLHFGSKTTREVLLELSFANEVHQYALRLAPTDNDDLFPTKEFAWLWGAGSSFSGDRVSLLPAERGKESGISNSELPYQAGWVRDRLAKWRLYHLHDTSAIRKTSRLDDNQFLRENGSNVASLLFYLRKKHESAYASIRSAVQLVAPFFDDFELLPRRLKPDDINLEWCHKNSDLFFDASSLSDGTLRFIALATLFLQPQTMRPSLLLIDEPELGLHPYAIEVLASMIRQASIDTQIIVSTQSSLLLDHFEPEDVLVADRVDGSTQISRLSSVRLANWLEDYSLGQLWEKNEIGGRPGSD